MTTFQRNILAVVTAAIIGMVAAKCSGCALVRPEGDVTMEVSE